MTDNPDRWCVTDRKGRTIFSADAVAREAARSQTKPFHAAKFLADGCDELTYIKKEPNP